MTGCFIAVLYLSGLRADRGVGMLTEPGKCLHRADCADGVETVADSTPGSVSVLYRNHTARYWALKFRHRSTQYRHARADLHRRWQPTVNYALKLASAVFHVPYHELASVSACESHHYPFAQNGQYKGIFQMHWSPYGFSPFDPIASALSAAETVVHDHGWRQWECRPH